MKFIKIFIACIFVFSCKKESEPTTVVDGYVYDYFTGLPLDSVYIGLSSGVGHSSGWFDLGGTGTAGNGSHSVAITDKSGYYKVSLTGENPFLFAVKKGFTFINPDGGETIYPVSYGENKAINIKMKGWAYFNPVFKYSGIRDEMDDSAIDLFSTINKDSIEDYYSICWGNVPCRIYPTCNRCIYIDGNVFLKYRLRYQVNSIWLSKIDSVFLEAGITYTDTIYY